MAAYYTESSGHDPWHNLALEQALADRIRMGDVILYLWQNERTVVIGKGQNALRECRGILLEEEGGFLARRTTGGGAVYHDLGNLCFTFLASPERYDLQKQMQVVMDAVGAFGIRTQLSGRNDIITGDGFKFSGNAFSVTRNCRIQHGTLMVSVDRDMLSRYLTPSKLKLSAKGIASVRSRVCNLADLCPAITVDALKTELLRAFIRAYAPEEGSVQMLGAQDVDGEALRHYTDIYSSWEWRYGKSPACDVTYEHAFEWGEVQILLTLTNMVITGCQVYSDCLDTTYPEKMRELLTGMRFVPDSFEELAKGMEAGPEESREEGRKESREEGRKESREEGQLGQMLSDTLRWLGTLK